MKKLKMYFLFLLSVVLSVYCEDLQQQQHEQQQQCPISCYCDSVSRYVHCQGGVHSNSKLLPSEVPKLTQRLELRDFEFGTLKWELIRDIFPNGLIELSIRNSDINEIINGSLSTLNKLSNLDLSHNNLYLIQAGSLDQLISLRHLDLSWNKIKEIKGNFLMLNNLETLDISNNKLEILSIKTFTGLQKIQWIDISSNSITKIEPGTFLPMSNLERLVLGNNPLISLQRLEFLGARLRYMDVSDMKLKRAPESLGPSVRELRATRNELKILQRGDLDSYPSLTLLDVSFNQLEFIEDDALGRLEYLLRVYLIGNKLDKIPKSLPRSLKVLYLDKNKIRTINTGDFQGLPRLQELSLSQNKLTIISSDIMAFLPGLRNLDLSKNSLKTTSFTLNGLEELNLSDNCEILLKSDAFSSLPHLRTLHLANMTQSLGANLKELLTPLSELNNLNLVGSPNLTQQVLTYELWFGLTELNLQNTSLKTLPDSLWNSMGKLKKIYLSNNEWNCSTDIQYKISTRDSKLRIMDENKLKCFSPDKFKDESLIIYNLTKEITAVPSLAPTRVQIAAPTSIQPNVSTNKPQSTAPLNHYELKKQLINDVDKIINKPQKKRLEKLQQVLTTSNINNKLIINNVTTSENFSTPPPPNSMINNLTQTNESSNDNNSQTTTPINNATTTEILPETTSIPEVITTSNIDINSSEFKEMNNYMTTDAVTTEYAPMDYEELAVVIEEEEFYEEPGNFSELRAGKILSNSDSNTNVPVGFLSVIGACILGAVVLAIYHCRQAKKWQRLHPQEETLHMDILSAEERVRW